MSDSYERGVIPLDQLISLSLTHLVEQGQLIANHHVTSVNQSTSFEVI